MKKRFTLVAFLCTMTACSILEKDRAEITKFAHDLTDESLNDVYQTKGKKKNER